MLSATVRPAKTRRQTSTAPTAPSRSPPSNANAIPMCQTMTEGTDRAADRHGHHCREVSDTGPDAKGLPPSGQGIVRVCGEAGQKGPVTPVWDGGGGDARHTITPRPIPGPPFLEVS
ncbi:hypothetical protein GCM10009657_05320 [Oryzihumus leptocrescens]